MALIVSSLLSPVLLGGGARAGTGCMQMSLGGFLMDLNASRCSKAALIHGSQLQSV